MALFFSGLNVDDESSGILFSLVLKEGEGERDRPALESLQGNLIHATQAFVDKKNL